MNFDWYQERTKDESSTIGGWATSLAYDFDLPGGYPAGLEVDWVSGGDIVHVDMNVFSAKDWRLGWLLLLPFVNYAKDWIRWVKAGWGCQCQPSTAVTVHPRACGAYGGRLCTSLAQTYVHKCRLDCTIDTLCCRHTGAGLLG